MTTRLSVSAQAARHLVLSMQGLGESHRRPMNEPSLLSLIDRLGFVQVDSINTVERAHHMILAARATGYRKTTLASLLEKRRSLFENWTHDASIIPSFFYPYWQRRFDNRRHVLADRYSRWHGPDFLKETDKVLAHIEQEGPVLSRDLSPKERKGPGAWWNWHPSKTALEYLWRTGALAISRREGFQKVYDLTHRIIPDQNRIETIDQMEFIDWSCRSALLRMGFGTPGEIAGYWDHVTADEVKGWCETHLGHDVQLVDIAQIDGRTRTLYALSTLEEAVQQVGPPPNSLRILSPFDPVLRDRKRLNGLFGFDYRIEVFVPEPKRKYGYYVFPVLEGDRLIGRIDMKAKRDQDVLSVIGFWSEPRSKLGQQRRMRLEKELDRHRKFAGVSHLRFEDGWLRDTM